MYRDFISEVVQSNPDLHYLVPYAEYSKTIAFTWYSAIFVLTIATMAGHIKFQLNQLCWTIVVLCLTLGQMKYIMHNIFNGLIWFTLPFLLGGVGRILGSLFLTISLCFIDSVVLHIVQLPIVGGGICTLIVAWYLS